MYAYLVFVFAELRVPTLKKYIFLYVSIFNQDHFQVLVLLTGIFYQETHIIYQILLALGEYWIERFNLLGYLVHMFLNS